MGSYEVNNKVQDNDSNALGNLYGNIRNGLSQNMFLMDIAKKHKVDINSLQMELNKGIEVEKEHTSSEDDARKIAMDHLSENPNYYTILLRAGL